MSNLIKNARVYASNLGRSELNAVSPPVGLRGINELR